MKNVTVITGGIKVELIGHGGVTTGRLLEVAAYFLANCSEPGGGPLRDWLDAIQVRGEYEPTPGDETRWVGYDYKLQGWINVKVEEVS